MNSRMSIQSCVVRSRRSVADGVFALSFEAPSIARLTRPGQFLNIRVNPGGEFMLRRPFSVYRIDGDSVEIVFNIVGRGTEALSKKEPGDLLDVLGPLGHGFDLEGNEFDTGILIGGGLGVAPLPMTVRALADAGKSVITYLGARTASLLVTEHLGDVRVATDDGSRGFHGNAVQFAAKDLASARPERCKVFACGPTPMLRAAAEFVTKHAFRCQVSLEGVMGCGIGICQGCPVRLTGPGKKYALMCKDGPVFDINDIEI
jgi:dihydroorotate dehydrogenase electron transfer subunit